MRNYIALEFIETCATGSVKFPCNEEGNIINTISYDRWLNELMKDCKVKVVERVDLEENREVLKGSDLSAR